MVKKKNKQTDSKKKNVVITGKDYPQCFLRKYNNWMNSYVIFNDTFRSSVVVYVWDLWEEETTKFFREELIKYWAEKEYYYWWLWLHLYNPSVWSIICLRDYDIWTLVHEVNHSKQAMFEWRWISWDEVESYYLENIIRSVLSLDYESWEKRFRYYPTENI